MSGVITTSVGFSFEKTSKIWVQMYAEDLSCYKRYVKWKGVVELNGPN